jgi:hypothetical protein
MTKHEQELESCPHWHIARAEQELSKANQGLTKEYVVAAELDDEAVGSGDMIHMLRGLADTCAWIERRIKLILKDAKVPPRKLKKLAD